MIPFLSINCDKLLSMSFSRDDLDTISPAVIASLTAKFSVFGFGSDSAIARRDLPML